jgi:hypothetical protein
MIEMRVSVDYHHGLTRDGFYGLAEVANSTTRVNQNCFLLAYDQIDNRLLIVTRFVENKKVGSNLIDFEPILSDCNLSESGILQSGSPFPFQSR